MDEVWVIVPYIMRNNKEAFLPNLIKSHEILNQRRIERLKNFNLPYTKSIYVCMYVFSHGVTVKHIFNYCQHKAVQQLDLLHADSSALLLNSTLVQSY